MKFLRYWPIATKLIQTAGNAQGVISVEFQKDAWITNQVENVL